MQIVKIGNKYAIKKCIGIEIERSGNCVKSIKPRDLYLDYLGRGWVEKDHISSMHNFLIDKLEDAVLLLAKKNEEEQPEIVLYDTDFIKPKNSDI